MRACAVIVMVATAGPTYAASPTLCAGSDKTVFSCQTRKGIASVCEDGSGPQGRLHYRFGQSGRVELSFPEKDVVPAKSFAADTLMYSGGGGAYLQFSKDDVTYTVFSAIGRWGNGARPLGISGVAVSRGGKDVADLPCQAPAQSSLGPDLFTRLSLQTPTSNPFDIPESFFPK